MAEPWDWDEVRKLSGAMSGTEVDARVALIHRIREGVQELRSARQLQDETEHNALTAIDYLAEEIQRAVNRREEINLDIREANEEVFVEMREERNRLKAALEKSVEVWKRMSPSDRLLGAWSVLGPMWEKTLSGK